MNNGRHLVGMSRREDDLDRWCGLCGAPLGAVTVFRLSETVGKRLAAPRQDLLDGPGR